MELLSIWGSGLAYPSGFAILDLLCGLSSRDMNPLVFEHDQPHMWNGPRCKELLIDFTRVDGAFICTALKHGT